MTYNFNELKGSNKLFYACLGIGNYSDNNNITISVIDEKSVKVTLGNGLVVFDRDYCKVRTHKKGGWEFYISRLYYQSIVNYYSAIYNNTHAM